MRKQVTDALMQLADREERMVFLTGDLGFMALEPLKEKLGKRFINAGISEQNMVSVAAAMAKDGYLPFLYSIAPFIICRPFEQIRNEAGLHNLPVKFIGNGGGYGYGIMGSTHHCLEDIALMRSVANMEVYVPLYNEDVQETIQLMASSAKPGYIRLNNSVAKPAEVASMAPYRQITKGGNGVLIGSGPVLLNAIQMNEQHQLGLNIWSINQLPAGPIPEALVAQLQQQGNMICIEEHYQAGGIGEMMAAKVLTTASLHKTPLRMLTLHAKGYPSGRYGDQNWHQQENHLAGAPLLEQLTTFLNEN